MSIIYDALKKIEKPAQIKTVEKKTDNKKKIILGVLILLIFVVGINSYLNITGKTQSQKNTQPAPQIIETMPQEKLPPLASEETPVPEAEPVLILNGVFFDKNTAYCIINNRVTKELDTIEGAQIKSISMEKVVLEFKGREITLNNSSK